MINSQLGDGVYAQTTTIVKSMALPNGECTHTSIVRVSRAQNEVNFESPKITNTIAEQQSNTLKRITEIQYLKLKYVVEDRYLFQNTNKNQHQKREEKSFISSNQDSGNSNQSKHQYPTRIKRNRNKKLCLFQKIARDRDGKIFIKRNTKNIPKNFCKAFMNHMQNLPNKTQEWELVIKDFKKIERKSKNKYNNILMHRLLSNPRICVYFKQFLEHQAADWINHSKITDKQIHLEAINIYLNLLNNLAYAEVDPSPSDQ